MKILCVVDVQRRQKSENIGLNSRDQDFQRADGNHQDQAWDTDQATVNRARIHTANHEAGEHFQQYVAGHHGNEQTQRQAERTNEERDQLDHRDKPDQPQRRAVRHEQAEKVQAVLPEPERRCRN